MLHELYLTMIHELYPKIYLSCEGWILTLQRPIWPIFFTLQLFIIYYSNKCQLFCTCQHSEGGKRGSKVWELLLKPIYKDGYGAMGEICMRIMDSVHY